jgi:hypothetical protein
MAGSFHPDGAFAEQVLHGLLELLIEGHEVVWAEAESAFLLAGLDVEEHFRVPSELPNGLPELPHGLRPRVLRDPDVHLARLRLLLRLLLLRWRRRSAVRSWSGC